MTNINFLVNSHDIVRIFVLGFFGFLVTTVLTPAYTELAYRGRWWKKPRSTTISGEQATVFQKLHQAKHRRHIPTMAGAVFVLAVALVTLVSNLSRTETWLPLAAMAGAGCIGLIDDIININSNGNGIAGMRTKVKALMLLAIAIIGGWWFFDKLGVVSVHVPFWHDFHIGWVIIPLFTLVIFATANAVNITDGLDGLAGGLGAIAFGAYAVIALLERKFGISGFCMTVVGALLSYSWFNIFPARFFMGDIGSFAIGTALGVVAMLTNTVLLLPIIGAVFVIETGSVIVQNISKKIRGRKIWLSTPIHHHLEAIGWPEAKVTMRFWVIGQIAAFAGIITYILGGR